MNQKKKLLIKVLNKLLPYWDLAEGIIALVNSKYIDENTIDALLLIITQAIKTTKKKQQKEKLERSISAIQKIKDQEEFDQEDADKLLETI